MTDPVLDRLLEWTAAQATINRYGSPEYSEFVCHVANLLDPRARAACDCEWVSPHGFVVAAGCPEHD